MGKITKLDLLLQPQRIVNNYNKFEQYRELSEHIIQELRHTIEQYEADNQSLQQDIDSMKLSHDWYVKYTQKVEEKHALEATLTERNATIERLQEHLGNARKQIANLQENARRSDKKKIPAYDRRYVRKLQAQFNEKCEKCHELTLRVKQLEGDIVTLTLNKEQQ